MAAIPFILHICNDEGNGTLPRVPSTILSGTEWLFTRQGTKLKRTIPYDPTTGYIPASINFLPWWDASLNSNLGNWTVYAPVAGQIFSDPTYSSNKGDNTTSLGTGFGSSAAYMQKFADYFTTSPYFKAMKLPLGGTPGGSMLGYKSGGASRIIADTYITRAKSLISPDTLDLRLIIIDTNGDDGSSSAGGGDMKNWLTVAASYYDDLIDYIDYLRNTVFNSPNALVILINHAPSYLYTTTSNGLWNAFFRALNIFASQSLTNVKVLQMKDEDLQNSNHIIYTAVQGSDPAFYCQEAYIKQGNDIFDMYKRWAESSDIPDLGTTIPTFYGIGDSIWAGLGGFTAAAQENLASPGLLGPRPNQFVYNGINDQIEEITGGVSGNTNTVGNQSNYVGPIYTLSDRLADDYPDGLLFVSMGKGGAHLDAEEASANPYEAHAYGSFVKGKNENYEQLQTAIASTQYYSLTQTGSVEIKKHPVPYGIFMSIGENNVLSINSANIFAQNLIPFIKNFRLDFCIKLYGVETPIVMLLPHINASHGTAEARAIVRNAIISACKTQKNVGYVSQDDYDLCGDNLHPSAETYMLIGVDMYKEFKRLMAAAIPTL